MILQAPWHLVHSRDVTASGLLAIFLLAQSQSSGVRDLMMSGMKALSERRFDDAIRDLSKAVALDPKSSGPHLYLGQAYLAKGRPEFIAEAKGEFLEARDLNPKDTFASFFIAKIDLDLGRIAAAERELKAALERDANEYVVALMGEVKRRQGRPEEAIEWLSKAAPSVPLYYYRALAWWDTKNAERALDDLSHLLRGPEAGPDGHMLAGVIYLAMNKLPEAEGALRKAIALDGQRAEPRLRLAQTLRLQRRFDAALKELDLVEAAPQLSSPYFEKLIHEAAAERKLILRERP